MTWIILQFVFLAMPVVLPALLYRSRRCFMARFYDKWCGAKRPAGCTPMCCLSYYSCFIMSIRVDTPASSVSCHLPSCVPHGPLSGGRTDGCAACSTGQRYVWFALLALVIGFVPHLYTMAVTIAFVLLAALFYPSARVMSEKTDIRKFLEWLECPGALADSYHSIITRGCHDNADNGNLKLSAHYESSKTE